MQVCGQAWGQAGGQASRQPSTRRGMVVTSRLAGAVFRVLAALAILMTSHPTRAQPAADPGPTSATPQPAQPASPAPQPATPETPETPPGAAALTAPTLDEQSLSLGAVLQVAVRQQPSLIQAAIDIEIAEAAVVQATGAFDWTLDATGRVRSQRSKSVNSELGVRTDSEVDVYSLSGNLSRIFAIGGALSVGASAAYSDINTTNDLGGIVNQQSVQNYDTALNASYTQSLLRNRGEKYGLASLNQLALSRDAETLALRTSAATSIRQVIEAYWDLALAEQELVISQNSLALAQEQLRNTRIAIRAGSVAATEALAVEQTIALREENVLLAELTIAQSSLTLRRQAGLEIGPGNIDMNTSAPLAMTPAQFDIDALMARAMATSPELARLETLKQGAQIEVEVTENGLLPQLDLTVNLSTSGSDPGLGESLKQTGTLDITSISGVLTLRHDLGNRTARGAEYQARANLQRQRIGIQDVKAQIASSLVVAVKQAQVSARRVELSDRAIELAEKNIKAEQARFELGRSTNFDVLQRQDDLRQAQLRRARAINSYLQAVATIDSITGDILPKYGIRLDR